MRSPPHLEKVLFVMKGQNHTPGTQKEQGFKEGVGDQMKDAGAEGPDTNGYKHVAQLADRGISQNLLDIPLCQGDEGRHEGGDDATSAMMKRGSGARL